MNLDHSKMVGTGRTTRMLQHAIYRATQGLPSLILGDGPSHIGGLRKAMSKMLDSVDDLPQRVRLGDLISYGTLGEMTRNNNRGVSRFYDYGTHSFKFEVAENTEVLVDHYALERQLVNVISYLRTIYTVRHRMQWLVDTARMMSSMGRRVYLVTESSDYKGWAELELDGYNVSIEDGSHLNNLNLLKLEMVGANPNCVLLVDPSMLEGIFGGALKEINRWDKKPEMSAVPPRSLNPHLSEALDFAQKYGPCMVVVDTIEAMNKAVETLAPHGFVYSMSASLSPSERRDLLEKFENNPALSYLVVTKQLAALGGWKIDRTVSVAATGSLVPQMWAQIRGRVPAPTARFVNVRAGNAVVKRP